MRYLKIFSITVRNALETRSRSLVWFLISLITPLLMLFFWRGATHGDAEIVSGWNYSSLFVYFLLSIIGGSLLISHIEEDVADKDIKQGNLVAYLTKPFSYFKIKYLSELPWRLLQGSFGLVVFIFLAIFLHNLINFNMTFIQLMLTILVCILASLISFTFKIIVGVLGFWFTDSHGLFQLVDVLLVILAGYIVPLPLLPKFLQGIAQVLPFSYMNYFPVIVAQGKLDVLHTLVVLMSQIIWLVILIGLYNFLFNKGVRKFTGVGQ